MYRVIDTKTWNDPKIKKLSTEGKLVFIYLITNKDTHLSGIYTLPIVTIGYELNLSDRVLDRVFEEMDTLSLAYFDHETDTVFVENMFKYQGRGEKNQKSAASQLENLHNSPLINKFLDTYPDVKKYASDRVLDRVSDGYTVQGTGTGTGTGTGKPLARSADAQSGPDENIVLKIPLIPKDGVFEITEPMIDEWQEDFPGINVLSELKKAKAWNVANKTKRKTRVGIKKHLVGWLSRAQDQGKGKSDPRADWEDGVPPVGYGRSEGVVL